MGAQPRTPDRSELEEMIVMSVRVFCQEGDEDPAVRHHMTNPLYDISFARVIDADGRIVSAMQILPFEMYVRGAAVPMGGISCVATLPEYRKRGYAGTLCTDSIHRMRERGLYTSALMPFSYEYYGKFGWYEAGGRLAYEAVPQDLPRYAEASGVRPAESADFPAIAKIQYDAVRGRTGYFPRSELWWEANRAFRLGEIAVYDRGGIEGYVGHRLRKTRPEDGEQIQTRLAITEMVVGSPAAARGLSGFLAGFAGRAAAVTWNTDTATLHASELDRYAHTARYAPIFMFRVVDLAPALRCLFEGVVPIDEPLEIRIHDEIGAWNESPVWVTPDGVSTAPVKTAHRIEADVRHFSQLYIGYRSAAELVSLGRLTATGAAAVRLAEALFPRQEPFFPDPDSF